jgi:hypothetical protein
MLGQRRFGKIQTAVLVVIALVMGANLISPAVGHVKRSLKHLYKHLDPRYVNVGETVAQATTATNATNATNAANANLLDNTDSTAFLQSQGLIHITTSHKDWVVQGGAATVDYARNNAFFETAAAEVSQFVGTGPAVPVALYGRRVQLVGVEFCYDTFSNTTIDNVFLTAFVNSTTAFSNTMAAQFSDPTDRTDAACRVYNLAAPFTLTGEEFAEFSADVEYSAAGAFVVGRTTFILSPTTISAAPLTRAGPTMTLLPVEGGGPDSGITEK